MTFSLVETFDAQIHQSNAYVFELYIDMDYHQMELIDIIIYV